MLSSSMERGLLVLYRHTTFPPMHSFHPGRDQELRNRFQFTCSHRTTHSSPTFIHGSCICNSTPVSTAPSRPIGVLLSRGYGACSLIVMMPTLCMVLPMPVPRTKIFAPSFAQCHCARPGELVAEMKVTTRAITSMPSALFWPTSSDSFTGGMRTRPSHGFVRWVLHSVGASNKPIRLHVVAMERSHRVCAGWHGARHFCVTHLYAHQSTRPP